MLTALKNPTKFFGSFFLFCLSVLLTPLIRAEVELFIPQIVSVLPHDSKAFTQGLVIADGYLYESTGLYGQSSLRQIDLQNGKILKHIQLSPQFFAEGIAVLGNSLFQLTWKEGKVLVYDLSTLQFQKILSYKGEGWGLCCDNSHFWMSNGTNRVVKRDPQHFTIVQNRLLKGDYDALKGINDLECVDQHLYANVWKKNVILRFDKNTGQLNGVIDASGLLTPLEQLVAGTEGVLNGIAYHSDRQTFFITGKRWPWLFEVRFIPK